MSALVNIPRLSNIVNAKKQFFLVYAGVRGAMAYALALKALKEFEGNSGEQMLIITLVFIAFTILYSSFTTNIAIVKCEILAESTTVRRSSITHEEVAFNQIHPEEHTFCFDKLKNFIIKVNKTYLVYYITRRTVLTKSIIESNQDSDQQNMTNLLIENQHNNIMNESNIFEMNYGKVILTKDYQGGFSIKGIKREV